MDSRTNSEKFVREIDFDDFGLTEMLRAVNDFFLDGTAGVIKYIWIFIKKLPHWIKEFFIEGLPWLYRKIKACVRYIFSGKLFRLVWNIVLVIPSFCLFALAFAWPFVGWYLTGKTDITWLAESTKWYWLTGGILWTTLIGWFGVRYGIVHGIFSNTADKICGLFFKAVD